MGNRLTQAASDAQPGAALAQDTSAPETSWAQAIYNEDLKAGSKGAGQPVTNADGTPTSAQLIKSLNLSNKTIQEQAAQIQAYEDKIRSFADAKKAENDYAEQVRRGQENDSPSDVVAGLMDRSSLSQLDKSNNEMAYLQDRIKNWQGSKNKQMDLSPIMQLVDTWTGSNFSSTYTKPQDAAQQTAQLEEMKYRLSKAQDANNNARAELMYKIAAKNMDYQEAVGRSLASAKGKEGINKDREKKRLFNGIKSNLVDLLLSYSKKSNKADFGEILKMKKDLGLASYQNIMMQTGGSDIMDQIHDGYQYYKKEYPDEGENAWVDQSLKDVKTLIDQGKLEIRGT